MKGQAPQKADVQRGQVVRVDQIADLALVKVSEVPTGVEPMPLGEMSEVAVGNDVHAIGHPAGKPGPTLELSARFAETTSGRVVSNRLLTKRMLCRPRRRSIGKLWWPLMSAEGEL